MATEIPDGLIDLDTPAGTLLGFTSARFEGYIWKIGEAILISFITSRQRGNFRELADRILSLGFTIKVPTPLGRMAEIVRKAGYRETWEDTELGSREVWIKRPDQGAVKEKPCS